MAKKTPEELEVEAKKLLEAAKKAREQRYTDFGKDVLQMLKDGKGEGIKPRAIELFGELK